MTFTRSFERLGLSMAVAASFGTVALPTQAAAAPICASLPSATTCVDPTGSCLVANYPDHGPATCLWNPIA